MHRVSLHSLAALAAACLFGNIIPAHATIDATLNTTNYIAGQASELSIDGVITQGGTSTSINGATVMIRFDPAKATLSGIRSGPNGWSVVASNTTYLSEGWARIVLGNSSGNAGEGQTSSGPIMYFTVTPVASNVDVNDCDTLQLSGSESDLSDQDYYTTIPSDPCNGVYASRGGQDIPEEVPGGRGMEPMTASTDPCAKDLDGAVRALKIAAGILTATEADVVVFDQNGDGKVTLPDVVPILKASCSPTPTGWFMFQGDAQHTGLAAQPLSPNITVKWGVDTATTGDVKYATYHDQLTERYRYLEPSVLAIPDPNPSPYNSATLVYAATAFMPKTPPVGQLLRPYTKVYRVKDVINVAPTTTTVTIDAFYATGTPLVVDNTLILTGITNLVDQATTAYPAHGRVIALNATTLVELWHRDLPGTIFSSPVYSPGMTAYHDQDGLLRHSPGGCVVIAADDSYITPFTGEYQRSSYPPWSYMFALSIKTGKHVWGNTYRTSDIANDGDLVTLPYPSNGTLGDLRPLVYSSSYSSPAIMGDRVFTQDHSCYVNARELTNGAYAWENRVDFWHEESSITVSSGRLHWGVMDGGSPPSLEDGGASCMAEADVPGHPDQHVGVPQWTTVSDLNGDPYYPDDIGGVWGGVVVQPTDGIAVFADLQGYVYGADALGDPRTQTTLPGWLSKCNIGSAMYCSPLLATDPTTGIWNAFIGADDMKVHILQTGETPIGNRELSPLTDGGQPLNGNIRSSMASLDGRLYVLSAGIINTNGAFTKNPRLYCFGQ